MISWKLSAERSKDIDTSRFQHCAIFGGFGQVGRMLGNLLSATGARITVIDPLAPDDGSIAGTVLRIDARSDDRRLIEAIRTADVVILALPESVALSLAVSVATEMDKRALLVHTLSVQSGIATALAGIREDIEILGINPMFAPSLGIARRPVAAMALQDGIATRDFLSLLTAAGAKLVKMDPEDHDRRSAATQALTHAAVLIFGLALAELDVDVEELLEIAPPPHLALLGVLARILDGQPQVYWDIQAANPAAEPARGALSAGLSRLTSAVDAADPDGFNRLVIELRDLLGPSRRPLAELSAAMLSLAVLPADGRES